MPITTTEVLHITFGDGCDDDTVSTLLHHANGAGWVVRLTTRLNNGSESTVDAQIIGGCSVNDVELGVRFRMWDEPSGEPVGEPFDVAMSRIVEMQIY